MSPDTLLSKRNRMNMNLIGGEVWLFSYGTLRQLNVQLAIFGRALDGRADVLPGYSFSPLQITDPGVIATSGTAHHTIIHEPPRYSAKPCCRRWCPASKRCVVLNCS